MTYNEEYYRTGTWWWNSKFQAIVKLVYVRNQCDIEIHTQRGVWAVETVMYADMPAQMHRIKNFDKSMLPTRYEYPDSVVAARAHQEQLRQQERDQKRSEQYKQALPILKQILKK